MSIIYDAKELQEFWEGGGVCNCITFPCDCGQTEPVECPSGYVWNDQSQQCVLANILPYEPEPCSGTWKDGVCVPRTTKPYEEVPIIPGPGGGGPGGTGGTNPTPTTGGTGTTTTGGGTPVLGGLIDTLTGEDGTNIFGFSPLTVLAVGAAIFVFTKGKR